MVPAGGIHAPPGTCSSFSPDRSIWLFAVATKRLIFLTIKKSTPQKL